MSQEEEYAYVVVMFPKGEEGEQYIWRVHTDLRDAKLAGMDRLRAHHLKTEGAAWSRSDRGDDYWSKDGVLWVRVEAHKIIRRAP